MSGAGLRGKIAPRFHRPLLKVCVMPRVSAGLLMYRIHAGQVARCFLLIPVALLTRTRTMGHGRFPKSEIGPGEELARDRQAENSREETGVIPIGPFIALKPIQQKGGKIVHAWAFKGDCEPAAIVSNTFTIEWPPKSGRQTEFPEIDRADFFEVAAAMRKIKAGQEALIEELAGTRPRQSFTGQLMARFIPATKLEKYDVFGHFSVEVEPNTIVACRSVLEIIRNDRTPKNTSELSERKPDAVFIN